MFQLRRFKPDVGLIILNDATMNGQIGQQKSESGQQVRPWFSEVLINHLRRILILATHVSPFLVLNVGGKRERAEALAARGFTAP
jgi:hypothetical protein